MLSTRKDDRRRVIVILGEGRDLGSDTSRNQALRDAQIANVSIYTVELSSFKALASKPAPGYTVDPLPPGSRPQRSGQTVADQAGAGANGFDLWTPTKETVRAAKALIWAHPMKTYAGDTGSDHINATKTKAVEEAVQRIGRELHSQYWLTYIPNNLRAEEYHTIEVKVNRPGIKARARPGYMYIPSSGEVVDPEKLPKQ